MSHISALIRHTTRKRGLIAEQKADDLLKHLLDGGKISAIIRVHECSFMNKVLKTDKIIRRLDGTLVPIQVKSSPTQGIAFTEFLTEYITENWAYPLILVFPPHFRWEENVSSVLRKINLWQGKEKFQYEDWQVEHSPYLDFSKFKIFGRSIQLRVKSFLKARADPAKAEEHRKLDATHRKNILEARKKRTEKRRENPQAKRNEVARDKTVQPLIPLENWDFDPAEEQKIDCLFESLRQEWRIIDFFKVKPYSWLALVWQTDVVVKRLDGVFVPIRARKSRQVRENKTAKDLMNFFEVNYGSAPLFVDTENLECDEIKGWAGNFTCADWMIENENYFDPKQLKSWDWQARVINFLQLKWLKHRISEKMLCAAGIKTYRDKNGILFLS